LFWEFVATSRNCQLGMALLFNSAPVIQSRDPDVLAGAILPPRHPALGKATNNAADFLLASHPAIFGSIARAIKVGSSDAYFYYWASWAFIISSILALMALKLNEAGACMGG
jgi:hypothetical protein